MLGSSRPLARGVTAGCGGGNFCPTGTVTHGQMAVFLLRTWETGYTAPPRRPAPPALLFSDVPCTDPFAPWIEGWVIPIDEKAARALKSNFAPITQQDRNERSKDSRRRMILA